MQIERFDFLRKQFSSYEMKFSEDGSTVEIVNPFGNENVRVTGSGRFSSVKGSVIPAS